MGVPLPLPPHVQAVLPISPAQQGPDSTPVQVSTAAPPSAKSLPGPPGSCYLVWHGEAAQGAVSVLWSSSWSAGTSSPE